MRNPNFDNNHLVLLLERYKTAPIIFEKDLVKTIDKIINDTIRGNKYISTFKNMESFDDTFQDLRLVCLKVINKLKPPINNKRIYNYLVISIRFAILEKAKNLSKFIDREQKNLPLQDFKNTKKDDLIFDSVFIFNDHELDSIADYLKEGNTKKYIRDELKLSQGKLEKILSNMKDIINDKEPI
jgi:hypothetical protein